MSANSVGPDCLPEFGSRFHEVSWLARGGQGGVAQARLGGRRVVLKRIEGELSMGAAAVFGLLQEVGSPHLPDALELARDAAGHAWLVTSFIEGEPLGVAAVELETMLDEAVAVAHALRVLHGAGTHHGDVSASNVLRTSTGGVVLTDLGTLGARGVGTPGFIAPESLQGGGGPAADRFALGALMCARTFGALPWTRPEALVALTPAQVQARLGELAAASRGGARRDAGDPALVATLRLMQRLLDPRPERRPDDPQALLRSLETLRSFARAGDLARGLTQWWVPRRWPFFGPLEPRVRSLAAQLLDAEGPRLLVVYGPEASGRGRVVRELAAILQREGLDAPALDAEAFDDGSRGGWLERWLERSQGAGDEGAGSAALRLCVQTPNWPERFEGEGPDVDALRLAVLRAGAKLGRERLVCVMPRSIGEALSQLADAQVATLEVEPLTLEAVRRVASAVVESPEAESFASLAFELSGGWPASLVRCFRAAARRDLQRPDAAAWREELEASAPTMDPALARGVLMRAWGVEDAQLPARVCVDEVPLAWALRAARVALGEGSLAIAKACGERLRGLGRPWPLALALELDAPEAIDAALRRAEAQGRTPLEDPALARRLGAWLQGRPQGGGHPTLETRWILDVAEAALAAGEPARAAELLEHMPLPAPESEAAQRRALMLARADLRRGAPGAALERLGAPPPAERLVARWNLERLALQLRAHLDAGEAEAASALVEALAVGAPTALGGDDEPELRRAWAAAAAAAGYASLSTGRGEAGRWLDAAIDALTQARTRADAGVRARALQLRGNLSLLEGDERRGRAHYAAAARAFEQAHERAPALWLEGNLAASALAAGELAEAVDKGRRVVRALIGRGELQALSAALWNAGEALGYTGADGEAIALCDASERLLRAGAASDLDLARVEATRALAGARIEAARARRHGGNWSAAREALADRVGALEAAGARREAADLACTCAAAARTEGEAADARAWLARASEMAQALDDAAVQLECRIEEVEQARRFGSLEALRSVADALASRPEVASAAPSGRTLLAWKIDRALFRAVLRLRGPADAATRALRHRALRHLETIMSETTKTDRPAAREALVTEFSERGALEELLRDLSQEADEPAPASVQAPPRRPPPMTSDDARAKRLLKMYRRLAREDDLERLLEQVCDAMMELTDAERGVVVVRSGETRLELAREFSEREGEGTRFSKSIIEKVMESGAPLLSVDASEDDRFDQSKSISHLNLRSVVAVPLRCRGELLGAAYVDHRLRRGAFSESDLALMEDFAELAGLAVAHAHALHEARQRAESLAREQSELSSLLDLRDAEVQGLRETLRQHRDVRGVYRGMVGSSPPMQKLYRLIDRLADSEVPVVIYGESGTGKELVARALHDAGGRAAGPFVAENCGAIPETLLESVFFGHAKGAFTGANSARPGLFEAADGGTIFLDEIGEMSPGMQTKLLRVLQEGEVRRVGETQTRKVDVRVVAASNKDLQALVEAGVFRRDLFYRINVVRLELPPLRDRREDIVPLVEHFLERYGAQLEVSASARRQLLRYPWPGNVRELENEVQRWVALVEDRVRPDDLAAAISGAQGQVDDPDDLRIKPRVEALERVLIDRAMERSDGNQTHAAELLGLSRYGLQKKLKRMEEAPT